MKRKLSRVTKKSLEANQASTLVVLTCGEHVGLDGMCSNVVRSGLWFKGSGFRHALNPTPQTLNK